MLSKRTYRPNVLTSYRLKKKAAFTLAEVLITLGIIGVVAALTMPSIIVSYQTMVQRTQFKKAYNTVLNGFRLAEVNLGYHPLCYYSSGSSAEISDCNILREALGKSLNIIKICEDNALTNGCIPDYKGFDTIYTDEHPDATEDEINSAVSGVSGWKKNTIATRSYVFVLADGVIIILYYKNPSLFAIDINGMKEPNKWGYDLFPFKLTSDYEKALNIGSGGNIIEKGGFSTTHMIENMGK